jgi:hypothetical protein
MLTTAMLTTAMLTVAAALASGRSTMTILTRALLTRALLTSGSTYYACCACEWKVDSQVKCAPQHAHEGGASSKGTQRGGCSIAARAA